MNRFASSNGGVELQTSRSTNGTNGGVQSRARQRAGKSRPTGSADGATSERETASEPATASGGRAADGKFLKDNVGGPGNPFARQTAALRKMLIGAVTSEDIQAIAHKLIEQAKEGDVASAKLLFGYVIGKPTQAIDPDTLNLLEWNLVKQSPVDLGQLNTTVSGLPVEVVCKLLRYVMPCVSANAGSALSEGFRTGDMATVVDRLAPRPGFQAPAAMPPATRRTRERGGES